MGKGDASPFSLVTYESTDIAEGDTDGLWTQKIESNLMLTHVIVIYITSD